MEQFIKDIVAYDKQARERVAVQKQQLQEYSSELKTEVATLYETYAIDEQRKLSTYEAELKKDYDSYVMQQEQHKQAEIAYYQSLSQNQSQYVASMVNKICEGLKEEKL